MLNDDIETPLYQQLEQIISEAIHNNEFAPGQKVPGEVDLGRRYNVSRITVRKALSNLVEKGLLSRKQGKGTFVSVQKIERSFTTIKSFSQRMLSKGYDPGAKVIRISRINANDVTCKKLGIEKGSQAIEVIRVRLAQKIPVVLERSYLSYTDFPGVVNADLENNSLYSFLKQEHGVQPEGSHRTLEIGYSSAEEAQHLCLTPGKPVFLLKANVFSQHERPIEYLIAKFAADKIKFEI